MLDCETAALVVTRHLAKQSTIGNKMSMYMHIMACPGCRRYFHQQQNISMHLRQVAKSTNGRLNARHLSSEEINSLDTFITDQLNNSHPQ